MKRKRSKKDTQGIILIITLFIVMVLIFSIGIYRDKKINAKNHKFAEEYNEKMYEELFEKQENDRRIKETLPSVVCWGDSLTAGVGGDGTTYPSILARLIKLEVDNFGVGGEASNTIAIRQGALSAYTSEFIIPKDVKDVKVNLYDEQGNNINLATQGDSGLNPCEIKGVIGKITYNGKEGAMYFRRETDGEEVNVENGTKLITSGSNIKKENDILIIFSGTNDSINASNVQNTIDLQKKMISYAGTEKYIIIGLTSKKHINDIEQVNSYMEQVYGDNFIDVRKYILENGLADSSIEATEKDKIDIQNGEIPSSLRVDEIHGNSYFYKIIGKQVYNKIIKLGYLNDEQKKYLEIE